MTDTFRKKYNPLTEDQKIRMAQIKDKAEELESLINDARTESNGRLIAMAQSHLEISVMCAVKGITA